jgi:hypothetical protein
VNRKSKHKLLDLKIPISTYFYSKTPRKHHRNLDKPIANPKITPKNKKKMSKKKTKGSLSIFSSMFIEKHHLH